MSRTKQGYSLKIWDAYRPARDCPATKTPVTVTLRGFLRLRMRFLWLS